MSVYVDNMRAPLGRLIMCHMIADTDQELHAMADVIGVARKWHQGDHYDICLSKRAKAVELGAVEITLRQAGAMSARRKRIGQLGNPAEAEVWFRQHRKQTPKHLALERTLIDHQNLISSQP